jgi:hypothetical protein
MTVVPFAKLENFASSSGASPDYGFPLGRLRAEGSGYWHSQPETETVSVYIVSFETGSA